MALIKKLSLILISCFVINNNCFAACIDDLNKCQRINTSYQVSIDLYRKNQDLFTQEITELKKDNGNLQLALEKEKNFGFWNKALWFGLGVLATGATVYAFEKR